MKTSHAYIIYDISRCNQLTRNTAKLDPECQDTLTDTCDTVDPKCADPDEIDLWLESKKVMFRVINDKIDYHGYQNMVIRQNEQMLPSIPLKAGSFSDSGYRFRKNFIRLDDNWLPF